MKASETLSGIARRYNIEVAALRALNELPPDRDMLRIGQKLKVHEEGQVAAGDDPVVHVVRKGIRPG